MVIKDTVIRIKKLSFQYTSEELFSDLSFDIHKGEVFTLLGPNGCGKTTLINCILTFLKPKKGSIEILGSNVADLRPYEMAQKIAYVPQSHQKTFPYTVEEIVLMGRAAYTPSYSVPKEEDIAIAKEAIKMVGIESFAKRPYVHLSGGESQLVMLARAIAQDTDIIILDEPTAHLDSYNEMLVMDKLTDLIKEKRLTVIMSTHSPNQIFYLMNQGLSVHGGMMKSGRFLYEGPGEEILTESNISKLYDIKAKLVETTDESGRPIKQMISLGLGTREALHGG